MAEVDFASYTSGLSSADDDLRLSSFPQLLFHVAC